MTPDQEIQELRRWSAELLEWEEFISCWDGELWYFTKPTGKEAGDNIGGVPAIKFSAWLPDQDMNQTLGIFVKKMKELGWYLVIDFLPGEVIYAEFRKLINEGAPEVKFVHSEFATDSDLGIVILKAAKAAIN